MSIVSLLLMVGPLAPSHACAQSQGGTAPQPNQSSGTGARPQAAASMTTREGAALLVGPYHALTVRAPKSWVLDTRSGHRQGLSVVFYPEGQRWASSPSVMYCLVVPKDTAIRHMADMMHYEADRFRNGSPTAVIATEPSIRLHDTVSAAVRRFTGGASGNYEQVAYIEERAVIVMMVLSCRTPQAFNDALPAFTNLVKSYVFIGDDQENIQRAIEAADGE